MTRSQLMLQPLVDELPPAAASEADPELDVGDVGPEIEIGGGRRTPRGRWVDSDRLDGGLPRDADAAFAR